jgi:DNA-binding NtrC family response regulator
MSVIMLNRPKMCENDPSFSRTWLYHKGMRTDSEAGTAVVVMSRDDEDLKLIKSTLKKVGFEVVSFENGKEVGELLDARDPSLRLVVADPEVPELDFRQLLKKLHELDSPVRVLCLCEELPSSAYAEYIGAHLRRPFRRAHLLASILDATEKPLARTA